MMRVVQQHLPVGALQLMKLVHNNNLNVMGSDTHIHDINCCVQVLSLVVVAGINKMVKKGVHQMKRAHQRKC